MYCDIVRKPKKTSPPKSDELELVSEEQPPAQDESRAEEESESDTDSIPDLSRDSGLRFHLSKRSESLRVAAVHTAACHYFQSFFVLIWELHSEIVKRGRGEMYTVVFV